MYSGYAVDEGTQPEEAELSMGDTEEAGLGIGVTPVEASSIIESTGLATGRILELIKASSIVESTGLATGGRLELIEAYSIVESTGPATGGRVELNRFVSGLVGFTPGFVGFTIGLVGFAPGLVRMTWVD